MALPTLPGTLAHAAIAIIERLSKRLDGIKPQKLALYPDAFALVFHTLI
jgi:hypothetical protein